ncbi:MAG: NAD-dependent protein deacetylase [Myxococcales bacterium]|nr:NAD-dependent protein deacetylase [Myxococcales bacterium]
MVSGSRAGPRIGAAARGRLAYNLRVTGDPPARAIEEAAALLRGRRVVALTGAGCSTESGIPDYRGEGTERRAREPIRYQVFSAEPAARKRYWARSAVGWARFSSAQPNPAHVALAAMERAGVLAGVITQNVDTLHQAAGSARVVELHGSLAEVRCLACGAREPRRSLQARLLAENPGWAARVAALAPDGDAEIPEAWLAEFVELGCQACAGPLRPEVVFFGESVPPATRAAADALIAEAEALLVVGSSLVVLSGYRLVRAAAARAVPTVIVNLGPTRGDPHAALRVDARAGVVLPALAERLAAGYS